MVVGFEAYNITFYISFLYFSCDSFIGFAVLNIYIYIWQSIQICSKRLTLQLTTVLKKSQSAESE